MTRLHHEARTVFLAAGIAALFLFAGNGDGSSGGDVLAYALGVVAAAAGCIAAVTWVLGGGDDV